jgi:hypothetical protein
METLPKFLEAVKLLPYFNGEDRVTVYEFIEKVKIVKQLTRLNDRETFMIVKLKLNGEVSDFARAFENIFDTWEKLERALKHKFGDRASWEKLEQQLVTCKQEEGESVTDFMSRLLHIDQRLNDCVLPDGIGGESLRPEVIMGRVFCQFLAGLREDIRRFVRIRVPSSLGAALEIAQREEEWAKGTHTESFGNYVNGLGNKHTKKEYIKLKCYTCRKKGHIAANCLTTTKPVV